MVMATPGMHKIVERVCARQDVLDACAKRDLGAVITVLNGHGVTQGLIAELTGIRQGRLSEYARRKRAPMASATFEAFASGLGMPAAARQALGLANGQPRSLSLRLAPSQHTAAPDTGLEYPGTPGQAVDAVTMLWRGDLTSQRSSEKDPVVPAAWNDATIEWLVAPTSDPGGDTGSPGSVHVGISDVERFKATIEMFAQLDDRFGGGHARQSLIQYLSNDGDRLLRGQCPETVRTALMSAVAEATLLAAWMSYDSAPLSGLGQRYFIQALGLAQAAGNRLLGAGILDAMSHQATYTGRFQEAANLARAAKTGTTGVATATLTAHFHTMEARALARLGDAKACDQALSQAVRQFERRTPENGPDWFQYFNEAELSAEFGHCLRDLNRAADAAHHAERSTAIADSASFGRSDFFATMVLADAYLADGEPEQACATALAALTAGEKIRSGRCVNYLREFSEHLTLIGDSAPVRDFHEQALACRLWRIAAQTSQPAA
jgi:hypothetical protein